MYSVRREYSYLYRYLFRSIDPKMIMKLERNLTSLVVELMLVTNFENGITRKENLRKEK
jgi:hypothetical protein